MQTSITSKTTTPDQSPQQGEIMQVQIEGFGASRTSAFSLARRLRNTVKLYDFQGHEARPESYFDQFDFEVFVVIVRTSERLSPERENELRQAVVDFCANEPGNLKVVDI
jgi:hypothetical protein